MSNDPTQTQSQGGEEWQRARARSLQARRTPTQVPGYRVESCLGEGAYGEVWLATDLNNPGRRVAVKFYTHRGGDWALLAREVEKLNFLATDRYVVQLLDVGWNFDPPYYVMEYMEKGSLAERLRAGPLPVAEAVALFRDVAVGVVNAHNRGVLHCDLKPANILLGPDGKPRLADFGQSRLSNEQTPALGTLFYMAPEQADLRATPDARWDVYALGAVLYCLLTGRPPHRDDPGATVLDQPGPLEDRLARYRRLLQEAPAPRGHRRVHGVDRALADIIDRCLAVQPGKRYPNVQAVLSALDTRAQRRARRPLLVLGALGPVLLLIVMALLIRSELVTAVERSTDALTEENRDSNQFAAQAVAERVAGKIDRRWRTLEQEASAPRLKKLIQAARGKAVSTPEHAALQEWVDGGFRAHAHEVPSNSWAVLDETGSLLVRSPRDPRIDREFIGTNYAHKDFFHGLGRDRNPKSRRPPSLTHVHRSTVFASKMTGTRMVAFSVPIWRGNRTEPSEARLGVLMMTVEVGSFVELGARDGPSKSLLAVLVDRRRDDTGRKGAILEHPRLAELRKQKAGEKRLQFYENSERLRRGTWDPDYTDPVGANHPEFAGRWLAASAPVIVEGREDVRDTGWQVIVQERYEVAIGPVLDLEQDMLRSGWWSLGLAVTVVTALWLFVIVALNESTGSGVVARLRRWVGLRSDSLASAKDSLRSAGPARSLAGQAATVTEPLAPKQEGEPWPI
jgi:serine/threonine protein kinase